MINPSEYYTYLKGKDKVGAWKALPLIDEEGRKKAKYGFETILAVNAKAGKGEDLPENVKYHGPFYIDIDDESISKSIRAAKAVLKILRKVNVNLSGVRIWATGKKGFHFTIEMETFTTSDGYEKLPLAYKYMALEMGLPPETDFSVYSTGKGRMWRLPGRRRKDNGKYKVPISPEELEEMNASGYAAIVEEAREEFEFPVGVRNVFMEALFRRAMTKALSNPDIPPIFVDPEIKRLLKSSSEDEEEETYGLPPCAIEMLHGRLTKKKGFNDHSLQFGKAVAAFAPSNAQHLIQQFAAHTTGDNYNTEKKRRDHCTIAFRTAVRSTRYEWSCKAALSVLDKEPCQRCPIAFIRVEQEEAFHGIEPKKAEDYEKLGVVDLDDPNAPVPVINLGASNVRPREPTLQREAKEEKRRVSTRNSLETRAEKRIEEEKVEEASVLQAKITKTNAESSEPVQNENVDLINDEGLLATEEGYYFVGAKESRKISNFTLKLVRHFIEFVPAIGEDRRTAVKAEIYIGSRKVGSSIIEEEHWNSKASFLKPFQGLGNAGFYGKDDDVQKMRIVLMSNLPAISEQVRRVGSCGIHYEKIAGKDVFTYVEPNWSIDNFGNENKYSLFGKPPAYAPLLKDVSPLPKGENPVIAALMKINEPIAAAKMFAWYMAAFLKQHVLAIRKEFPILNVYGNRGSGKTQGNEMLASIHGTKYFRMVSATNIPSVTAFALWNNVASSTTVPLLLDEYNKSKINNRKYDDVGELLKDTYQAGSIERGTISRATAAGKSAHGAEVQIFPLLAPTAVFSEQGLTMPALVQRCVQVALSPEGLNYNNGAPRKAFRLVQENWPVLERFAKAAYMKAINLPLQQVKDWLDDGYRVIPIDIGDRPQHCFAVLLTGLNFFLMLQDELKLNLSRETIALKNTLIDYIKTSHVEIVESKNRSEVDIILDDMATMAALQHDGSSVIKLMEGVHYMVYQKEYIVLDAITCFSQYQRYVSLIKRGQMVVENLIQFKQLIQNESYVLDMAFRLPEFARGRPCIKLSREKMKLKGIEVTAFDTDPI